MSQKKTQKQFKTVKPVAKAKKTVKKIVEFYYMTPEKTDARALSQCIHAVDKEQIEIWTELNLMEVVMAHDSLIFQDARECFEDPLDLEFIRAHQYETLYQISYDVQDEPLVRRVMREVLEHMGGAVYGDTDDFEPSYTLENVDQMCAYE